MKQIWLPALSLLIASVVAPVQALTVLNRGNGGEIKSLDPHFIDGLNEAQVEGDGW
jgi:hypothetical protein